MKRLMVVLLLLLQSCAYRMHGLVTIDSFTEPHVQNISDEIRNGQIYIHINPDVGNVLLEKELKYKIANILKYYGYSITAYPDEAKNHLLFFYGKGKGKDKLQPDTNVTLHNFYNSWATVIETKQYNEHYHTLVLTLVDGKKLMANGKLETKWISKAEHIIEKDYRLETNYLIINSLEVFGENTRRVFRFVDTHEELLDVIDPIATQKRLEVEE